MKVHIGDLTPRAPMGLAGIGDVCDPSFTGPLTSDQQTICDLQAGITYRDSLLSDATATSADQTAGTAYRDSLLTQSSQQQQYLTWGLFGAGALLVLMLATSGGSGGRRR